MRNFRVSGVWEMSKKKLSDEYDVTENLFDKLTVTMEDPNKDYKVTIALPTGDDKKKKKSKIMNKLGEMAGAYE